MTNILALNQPKKYILALSGWGQNPSGLQSILTRTYENLLVLEYGDIISLEALHIQIERLSRQFIISGVIGWSLGGLLAAQIISKNLLPNIEWLTLISTPFDFVATESYLKFRDFFDKEPKAALRQYGILAVSDPIGAKPKYKTSGDSCVRNWGYWLRQLEKIKASEMDLSRLNRLRVEIFHGVRDEVIFSSEAIKWQKAVDSGALFIIDSGCHAVWLKVLKTQLKREA